MVFLQESSFQCYIRTTLSRNCSRNVIGKTAQTFILFCNVVKNISSGPSRMFKNVSCINIFLYLTLITLLERSLLISKSWRSAGSSKKGFFKNSWDCHDVSVATIRLSCLILLVNNSTKISMKADQKSEFFFGTQRSQQFRFSQLPYIHSRVSSPSSSQ